MVDKLTGKTAGELARQASLDQTKYKNLELGHALAEGLEVEVWKCIDAHVHKIQEPEFCVVMIIAKDPLISNLMRRKFYAWPFLPKPRPNQAVFLYSKLDDKIIRLWVLPEAYCMAALSVMVQVDKAWKNMKIWSDAFYSGKFFEFIRKQHGISLQSEAEYLDAHREELTQRAGNSVDSTFSDPRDFFNIAIEKVKDPENSLGNES